MSVTLEFIGRDGQTKKIRIDSDTLIGRGSVCRLRVGSERVSRKHCLVRVCDHRVVLQDLGSTNGTFVDGERLAPYEEVTVADGAEIVIGPARARIHLAKVAGEASRANWGQAGEMLRSETEPHHQNRESLDDAQRRGLDTVPVGLGDTANAARFLGERETIENDDLRNRDDELDDFLGQFD